MMRVQIPLPFLPRNERTSVVSIVMPQAEGTATPPLVKNPYNRMGNEITSSV
ncbi:MAG: hypothetical protein ACOYJK_11200 [Prevotella sp.]